MTVDVWLQHPTSRFLAHDMFAPVRRWTGAQPPAQEIPIEATLEALDEGGVSFGLLSAWHAPYEGALIANDEVEAWVSAHPTSLRRRWPPST